MRESLLGELSVLNMTLVVTSEAEQVCQLLVTLSGVTTELTSEALTSINTGLNALLALAHTYTESGDPAEAQAAQAITR